MRIPIGETPIRRFCGALLPALVLLLLTCRRDLPPGPADPAKNLALLDVFADRVQTDALRAQWLAATEPEANVVASRIGVQPLLSLTEDEIEALDERLRDPRQKRCLQAIHALVMHMQSESDPEVARLLARIVPLRQRLSTDVARELAPLLRQLVEARNRWASRHGRGGYLELMQHYRGYDPNVANRLEAQVRRSLQSQAIPKTLPSINAARFDAAHNLDRAAFVFQYLGLPDHPPALQVREAKQSAFASFAFYALDPPHDQGITVRPGAGIDPHWSAFHEYGHAAMSLLTVPASCRTSRRAISPAVAEGCAKITERLFYSEEWLRLQNVPPDEIRALQNWELQSERMRMQSILGDIEFERTLYRDPTANVDSAKFPSWSLKRNLALEPLARTDYLLARCAQAALYRRLRAMPGGLLGDEAKRFVREQVFRGASELRFEEWFVKITGEQPDCSAWLEDVAKATAAAAPTTSR